MTRCVNYAVCGNVIERESDGWWEIIGWEKPRKQGGTNAVFERRRTGAAMCIPCATRVKHTGSPNQGGLFDGP